MEEKDTKQKSIKKTAGIITVASIASMAILINSTFDAPSELFEPDKYHKIPLAEIDFGNDLDDEQKENEEDNKKESLRDKFIKLIYTIPVPIRSIICIPLWLLGSGLLTIFNILWGFVLSPLLGFIINWAISTIILLLIVGVAIKCLFPNLPWRKIFNKNTIITVIIASLIINIIDFVMPFIWQEYRIYRMASRFVLGLIVLVIIIRPFIKKKIEDMNTLVFSY